MSRVRHPADKEAERLQPHEPGRDRRQPYGKEHEDYSGGGVIRPPEEHTGKGQEPKPSRGK